MNYSRILVTGDVLRPFPAGAEWESATWKNIRWLAEILGPALRACGLWVSTLAWDEHVQRGESFYFDAPALYHRLGLDLHRQGWARLARTPHAPAELVAALEPAVEDALVVGYEMPDVMVDALRQLGRPYVDVILHPLRFLPDLVFALRTNVADFHRVLESQRLPEAVAAEQAAAIMAKAAWMPRPAELPPGTVLLLGQVGSDRAMVTADGRFASLQDHLARLHRLCCEHPLVLFKPHPYADQGDASVQAVARLPAIQRTNANFYHLLAQPEVEGVVALNSSGLVEARAFGRWAENLIPELYDFGGKAQPHAGQPGAPVPLTGAWLQPDFWRALLAGDPEAMLQTPATPLWAPNRLRRAMNADWGYGFIERICA